MSIIEIENEAAEAGTEPLDGNALDGLRTLERLMTQPVDGQTLPRRVPFKEIELLPVFNSRAIPDEQAIAGLVKVLANGEKLPPITVMRAGGRTFLVDGHQRLAAHVIHAGKRGRGQAFSVGVTYFTGSPADAVFATIETNSQHGVKLTSSERTDAAWKLVLIGEKNRPEITKATGVSRAWLTKMRTVKRMLGDAAADYASWPKALNEAEGRSKEPPTDDDLLEKKRMKAEKLTDQITRLIGGQHSDDPELMAMVIENYMGRRTVELIQELQHNHREALEEAEAQAEAEELEADF